MKTIKEPVTNEIVVKNSKFIAFLYPFESENDVVNLLKNLKSRYKKATHYCYAYIMDQIKRFDDDGEPNGTAGKPILNVLEKNDLSKVICIVIRYFGGIKLGAGGLIRAYSKATREVLAKCEDKLIPLVEHYQITFNFNYNQLKDINLLVSGYKIIDKQFNEYITYTILLNEDPSDIINKLILAEAHIVDKKKVS